MVYKTKMRSNEAVAQILSMQKDLGAFMSQVRNLMESEDSKVSK